MTELETMLKLKGTKINRTGITFRIPKDMLTFIDTLAESLEFSRQGVMETLLGAGIEQAKEELKKENK